jgi:hypothetical protein
MSQHVVQSGSTDSGRAIAHPILHLTRSPADAEAGLRGAAYRMMSRPLQPKSGLLKSCSVLVCRAPDFERRDAVAV